MTWRDCPDGHDRDLDDPGVAVIEPQPRDLGGFTVQRVLPARGRRMVGPFVFLDDAAVVPYVNRSGTDFFSSRIDLGCYYNHVLYQWDFSTICVK